MSLSKKQIAIGILVLTWLIFFSRTLTGQSLYFLDDLAVIFYPLEHVYEQAQRAWELPIWSNLFGFGHPLLAWNQLGFFNPVHILLRLLPLHAIVLLNVSTVMYFAAGLAGMYLFLRQQRLSSLASSLGALIFAFCGFNIGHLNHTNFYVASMLLPWLLLSINAQLKKPTWARTVGLALLVATVIVSAHPQAALYTLLAAAIWGIIAGSVALKQAQVRSQQLRLVGSLIAATLLALAFSSISWLPFLEFLPVTERSQDLPTDVLFEFSYPPSHAITLLYPTFFGDHSYYWGAKGFQELAAYVGIVPLILATVAACHWRRHRSLRIAGLTLVGAGIILALGKYSPIYRWLIEEHIVTSLNIPGRFVFWVDIGLALLAALGLDDITRLSRPAFRHKTRLAFVGLAVTLAVVLPILFRLPSDHRIANQILRILSLTHLDTLLLIAGGGAFLWWYIRPAAKYIPALLVVITAITLLHFGWNYNPVIPREEALQTPPFIDALAAAASDSPAPRLYARPDLLLSEAPPAYLFPTDPIGPTFTIHQTVPVARLRNCLIIPMFAKAGGADTVQVSLRQDFNSKVLEEATLSALTLQSRPEGTLCFEKLNELAGDTALLTFSSPDPTSINLYYEASPDEASVYFVRVANPTPAQLAQSKKLARLLVRDVPPNDTELLHALWPRHLQAVAGVSGARWIGALSPQSFREFVDIILANDLDEPIDGDGRHILDRNIRLFNMAGITHFIQLLPPNAHDLMPAAGFTVVAETPVKNYTARLYHNPAAFPKAYLIGSATWSKADDETRYALRDSAFDPTRRVIVSGPIEPAQLPTSSLALTPATITHYENTRVDVSTVTSEPAVLVVTDTTLPQWQTYIDGQPAPYLKANTVFKAAILPAGTHEVSFRYESPAIRRAGYLTLLGLLVAALGFTPRIYRASARLATRHT